MAFGGAGAPPGWKLCDGSSVSRIEKPALFAAIGTSWGSGDGQTTFNLPDLRGRFLRGVDQGVARDPDRAARVAPAPGGNSGDLVGSSQDDALESHTHSLPSLTATVVGLTNGGTAVTTISGTVTVQSGGVTAGGAAETRPKNANVNYIIKE